MNAARHWFLKECESQGQGIKVKVIDFQEVNGKKSEASDSPGHELCIKAEIEFQEAALLRGDLVASKGDRIKFAGVMIGEKDDAGWSFKIGSVKPTWASNPVLIEPPSRPGSQVSADRPSNLNTANPTYQRNSCINNLRQLDGAAQQYALEHKLPSTATYTLADLKPYIKLNSDGSIPSCPAGGTYSPGTTVAESPTCSVPGHVLP